MNSVKPALWLEERSLWLEYRRAIDVIEWCDSARDQSLESSQNDWSTKFCKLFLRIADKQGQIFARKEKLSDKKLDKDRWESPQSG